MNQGVSCKAWNNCLKRKTIFFLNGTVLWTFRQNRKKQQQQKKKLFVTVIWPKRYDQ